jgi:DNA-directed RNA polymerase specialized sigma24 family protein
MVYLVLGQSMNEQALIQDVKANGSEDSFKELTELHKKRLLAFIRKFTHSNPIDQMDVYNKTLLRVWDNIGQYQEDKCFKWWLFQIAKNVFFN